MTSLPLLLTLLLSTAVAAPWSDEADALLSDFDDRARVELLAELALDEGTEVEAITALHEMLSEPDLRGDASRLLSKALLSTPLRAGWSDIYRDAAAAESDPGLSYDLRLRQVLALADAKRTRPAARALLDGISSRDRDETDVVRGHLDLMDGDPGDAFDSFRRAIALREAREGLVLASIASPHSKKGFADWVRLLAAAGIAEESITGSLGRAPSSDADIPAMRALLLEERGPSSRLALRGDRALLEGAAATAVPITRAAALESWGYDSLAIEVLEEDPQGARASDQLASLMMLGRIHLRRDETKDAVDVLERAVQLESNDPDLRRLLAMALVADGKAMAAKDAVPTDDPKTKKIVESYVNLQAARLSESRSAELDYLRDAYRLDPDNPDLAAEYGLHLYRSAQKDTSREPLLKALQNGAWSSEAAFDYAEASLYTRQPDEALVVIRDALGRPLSELDRSGMERTLRAAWVRKGELAKTQEDAQGAQDAYAVAYVLEPDDPGILRGLGGTLWGQGDKEEAYRFYKVAFERDPKDRDGLEALVSLGIQLDKEAELRLLLDKYRRHPNVRTALRDLDLIEDIQAAEAAAARRDYEDALARYRALRAKAPDNPTVLRGMASVRLARGEKEEALELFAKARALDGGDPWAILAEANALTAVRAFDSADELLVGLDDQPDPSVRDEITRTRARLWLERGRAAQDDDRDKEAFEAYKKALEIQTDLDPTGNTWVYTNIASLYAKHGQYGIARGWYRAAADLDASNVYAPLGIVGMFIDRGRLEEAELTLDTLPPEQPDVQAARTRIRVVRAQAEADDAHRIGEHETAREILKDLAEREPDSALAQAAWEAERLDVGTDEARFANARSILTLDDPANLRALGTLLDAGHRLRKTASVIPIFDKATRQPEATPDHEELLETARLMARIERAFTIKEEGRHDDAVGLLDQLSEDAGADADASTLIGGAYLELRETKRAHEAFDAALLARVDDPAATVGKAGTYAVQGSPGKGISLLSEAFERTGNPVIGLELARLYQAERQYKKADEVLDEVAVRSAPGSVVRDPIPEDLPLPPGYDAPDFPGPADDAPTDPRVEVQRRALKDKAPGGWKPGIDVGVGVYTRPGFSGEQFLTAFFIPIRLHELRAGPIAFDVEAVPYILSDGVDSAQGVQLSAGLQAGLGPILLHLRGGASPLGFQTTPYFIWYGNLDAAITKQVRLGFLTSREPVADSLTSFAGKADATGQFFGRVHRTSFGGYLGVAPTEQSSLNIYGKGGWNDDVTPGAGGMARVAFWDVGAGGAYTFRWDPWGLKVGANVMGMSFSDQVDLFIPGEGGFFSPQLFVQGTVLVEGSVRTRDDKFYGCVGGSAGPQYIDVIDPATDARRYIEPGVFFGYGLRAAIDWHMAPLWWLGVDFSRIVTGSNWSQNNAMVHVHFGPNDAWSRQQYPVYSPLAGAPVLQSQACGH